MKHSYWLIVLIWVVAVAARTQAAPPPPRGVITEISVEHTQCEGPCPIYKLTLRRDGTATLVGVQSTDHVGTYTTRVGGFDRLAQVLQRKGFFQLQSRYAAPVTDMPTVIISVVQDGIRKTVSDYGDAGPEPLWEMETLIDGMVSQYRWHKVSGSTQYPPAKP